jgi:hypothetical protein
MISRFSAALAVCAVLLAGVSGACAAEPAAQAEAAPVAAQSLIFPRAKVQTSVEVYGAAAVQLVGGALDAAAAAVEEQLKALQASGADSESADLLKLVGLVGPAKDIAKSLDHMTVLVMQVPQTVTDDAFIDYYLSRLQKQNWQPLMVMRGGDPSAPSIVALVAPEGKGVLGALVAPGKEGRTMAAVMVTTKRPIDDLLAQLVVAGKPALAMFAKAVARESQESPAPGPEPTRSQPETPQEPQ